MLLLCQNATDWRIRVNPGIVDALAEPKKRSVGALLWITYAARYNLKAATAGILAAMTAGAGEKI